MWERFLNHQSDWDWAWGPLLPLRPPPSEPMRPWVWIRLFLAFTLLGVLLIAVLALVGVLLPSWALAKHRPLPPPVAETLATVNAMGADPGTRLLLLGLLFCLPPLFFLFCLPYHWAWNRRAGRLQKETGNQERGEAKTTVGVWPPPPSA